MRLVDYLIFLLKAQAETLRNLHDLFGERVFLAILENAGEREKVQSQDEEKKPIWLPCACTPSGQSPYEELQDAVRDFKLPEVLEFYLWAYPHYRMFIESSLDLNSCLEGSNLELATALVDDAIKHGHAWIDQLPLPPEFKTKAMGEAKGPWLKFRTDVLKIIGRRPLERVR